MIFRKVLKHVNEKWLRFKRSQMYEELTKMLVQLIFFVAGFVTVRILVGLVRFILSF